ncbi:MAG: c-type cytochrome domain-containing protein [Verrucomicrobiota bacterium]
MAALPAAAQNEWDISKVDVSKLPPAADKQGLTYDKDIQPFFQASCIRCHGKEKPKASFQLDSLAGALKGGHDGKMIVPGESKKSLLVAAAARIDDKIAMPPQRKPRGPGGPGGPPPGGPGNGPPPSGDAGGAGGPGGPPGPGGPGGQGGPGRGGPPPKPLTAEQVGLIRAWIDQGAK